MATMTKRDILEKVVQRTGLKRPEVRIIIQEFLDQIIAELRRGSRIEFRDFGVFEIIERAARIAQNPKTMQKVTVPAKKAVKFKVGRLMRESISSKGGKAGGAKAPGSKPPVPQGPAAVSVTEIKPAPTPVGKKRPAKTATIRQ